MTAQLVLVTGASGNIGSHTVDSLLEAGHQVRVLAHHQPLPKRWASKVDVARGDVLDPASLAAAVRDVNVVVHLAYVIPPECLANPDAARKVNVDGTKNLLEAVKAQNPSARFLFASTLDVYGHTAHLPPPRRTTDPMVVTDVYSEHKIACEHLVRESGLTWGILRFADVPPIALRSPVPIMFELPPDQRIECVHPKDAGLGTARAATSDETWGQVWHIGGGASCQLLYRDYLARMFKGMEMGDALPDEAFTEKPWPTDWLDTTDSQRAFQFQRHTFQNIVDDCAALLGWKRPFAKLARPFVRRYMLKLSPYYRRHPSS